MSERPLTIPSDTRTRQAQASDPAVSAWVSAHAGSGKTFVLTQRVLRLLLADVAPEAILCLTYTKAAAAEMRHRVATALGAWARMEEARLEGELLALTGERPSAAQRNKARTLFAKALETPGGLKINTIHAFCEAVLQRFPREAGVPVDFSVIEEDARAQGLRSAREAVLSEGLKGHREVAEAVAYLFTHLSDAQIEAGISEALGAGRALDGVLADPRGAKAQSCAYLGVEPHEDEDTLLAQARAHTLVPFADYQRVFMVCPPNDAQNRFEDKLKRIDQAAPTLDQLFAAFLTQQGEVPKNLVKAALKRSEPDLAERLEAEAQRLAGLCARRRAIRMAARSCALIDVLKGIALKYEARKRARSLLDFDDLVTRTARLFANPDYSAWVRYKLDAGIAHILVDEGQDTNAQQWEVIAALSEDFFAGESAARARRTLFAVGDPKQSIYSFQGAQPELFLEKGRAYARAAQGADAPFADILLRTSFRTLPEILEGVDRTCARPDIAAALLTPDAPPRHESARKDSGGRIELWQPYAEPEALIPTDAWPTEPIATEQSAARQLAGRIVGTIEDWIARDAPLGPRGRPIRPEDILILVQSRKTLFAEIVRALKQRAIASPGADQLPVSGHIAVADLLALADVLLNPHDDLLLAALLRSPLYGLSEDTLYALAQPRGRGESLWAALAQSTRAEAMAAYDELFALRGRLDFDRPYGLFSHALYGLGGLKRFHGRLGTEVDDVIAAFLDLALEHEQSEQPSLTGFVAKMRASDITIKRDLAERGEGVRVMTVHGAKGLEAPIVFLADATEAAPALRQSVFFGQNAAGAPSLVFALGSTRDCPQSAALREAAKARQQAEYWRKLYVGMTRAEDHLIVAGTTSQTKAGAESWHEAIGQAIAAQPDPQTPGAVIGHFPQDPVAPAPIAADAVVHRNAEVAPLLLEAPARPTPRTMVSPSQIDVDVTDETLLASARETVLDAEAARQRGVALHALLQHLPRVPAHAREAVAQSAARNLLETHAALAADVAAQALSILQAPALASLFGPQSRAEVSFALDGVRADTPIRLVGRMDRLVITPDGVRVIDFKSDAAPPETLDGVPAGYTKQLALYRLAAQRLFPGSHVTAAILWTANGRLMDLPADALAQLAASYRLD